MKLNFVLYFNVVLIGHIASSNGARIFGMFPLPSLSHQIVYRALMEELAKRGHEVVVVTTDPVKYKENQFKNLTEIDVKEESYQVWNRVWNFMKTRQKETTPYEMVEVLYDTLIEIVDKQFSVSALQKLINDPEVKFDVCFFETYMPSVIALKDRFNCSMITMASTSGAIHSYQSVGNPVNPIMYGDFFAVDLFDLDFKQRFQAVYQHLSLRYLYWKNMGKLDAQARRVLGDGVRSIAEIDKEVDLLFLGTHHMLDGIRPVVPATIYMGNMHLKPPKPLPLDLQKFLDGASSGVVFFSFGSNAKAKDLPPQLIAIFLETMAELPYKFLWKWEGDALKNKPENIFTSKWFPQQDIFGHRNLKVFITQAGHQSVEEAIHNNVPLIAIPIMVDQFLNAKKIVKHGIGKALNLNTLSKEDLKQTIVEVMEDKSYQQNINRLSRIIADEPQKPLEKAVWWTEYLIRHGSAAHLRSPALHTPVYQQLGLDIIAVFLAIDFILIAVIYFGVKIVRKASKAAGIKTTSNGKKED